MKKKNMVSLGNKLTLLILLMAVTLSCASIIFGYQTYKNTMESQYISLGQNLTTTVASFVDGSRIDTYLETGETDAAYEETLSLMRIFKRDNNIEYLYVVKPIEEGTYYIYDTDESEERCELGYFEYWYDDFADSSTKFINGEEIPPIISNESFGWLLSVYAPIYGSDSTVKGYVGADFSMDGLIADRNSFLVSLMALTLVITVAFTIIYLYIVRKTIISPINAIAKAADEFLIEKPLAVGETAEVSSLSELYINTRDELESLADSMKSMEKKINHYILNLDVANRKAETDVLTGLYNRAAFIQRVGFYLRSDGASAEGQTHAFIMVDIDHFKQINDTYGHVAGDEVLKECAVQLKQIFRSSDYVARLGGDEFAVFCKSAGDIRIIEEKGQQICDAWRKISANNKGVSFISASVGIALVPKDGLLYKDLYQKADSALYEAKLKGRDQYALYKKGETKDKFES